MIRADWTPLWAADSSTIKALGPKQAACLELLRDRGPLTAAELRQAGIGLHTRDTLCLSYCFYPRLVAFDNGSPQRYYLAAPDQQAELDAMLTAVAAHPGGLDTKVLACDSERARWWRSAVIDHIINAHLARTNHNWVLSPAEPGDRPPPSTWWAGQAAARVPAWRRAVAAASH